MPLQNLDKFGNCIYCHRQLVMNRVVGGKIQTVLDPDASDSFFKLNTGSILVVPICKVCKATVDLDDPTVQAEVMVSVNEGWQLELNHMKENPQLFPDHTPEKEDVVNSLYASLSIVGHEANHKVGVQ